MTDIPLDNDVPEVVGQNFTCKILDRICVMMLVDINQTLQDRNARYVKTRAGIEKAQQAERML